MTNHYILPNFGFEYELAANLSTLSKPANAAFHKISAKWQHLLRLIPEFETAQILSPYSPNTKFEPLDNIPNSTVLAWGISRLSVEHLTPLSTQRIPDISAVYTVNDKQFSHHLEKQFHCALPHSCIVRSASELHKAIEFCPYDWIVKHPLGVSGREALRGSKNQLTSNIERWTARQFEQGWALIFEPKITLTKELSLQYDITPEGDAIFIGSCELLTDSVGTFRGHKVLPDTSLPDSIAMVAQKAIDHVQSQGYFGPVGIDAMIGSLGDTTILRPITEINARYTFGRLALELKRYIPPQWSYIWWHPSPKRLPTLLSHATIFIDSQIPESGIYRLPKFIGEPSPHSIVLAAPTTPCLDSLQQHYNNISE